MPEATLRYVPPHNKKYLSPSQYTSLTTAVSKVLGHAVSAPGNKLDVAWARGFIRSYAQDDAAYTLQTLDEEPRGHEKSPQELLIHRLTLQLAGRLAKVRGGLDASILVDMAVAYGRRNTKYLRTIYEEAIENTPSLLDDFRLDVVPAFARSLQDVSSKPSSSTRRTAYLLSHLLGFIPFVQDKEFVLVLAKCYHVGLDTFAASRGGMKLEEGAAGWQRDWLYTKAALIDSFHAIIQTFLRNNLPTDKDPLFDILFAILELPSSSMPDTLSSTPFISQPLLADYQYAFDLSGALNNKYQGGDDARVDLLAATLNDLSPPTRGPKPACGLSPLIKNDTRVQKTLPASGSTGKETAVTQHPEKEAVFDLAISQVLDIFPSHTPQYIQQCLEHPAFAGDPEKLISSFLEGTLPSELVENATSPENVPQSDVFEFINDRRNAWDGDAMDFSRLRIGKTRDDADALLQDRTFVEQMKSDIIRRAEELSEEEEGGTNKPLERNVALEDELDDGLSTLSAKRIKVAGDGEASDDADDEDDAEVPGPQKPSPETILELAYLDNPSLFDRDGATRRSKARAELKNKTGWDNEQIEGWRIMLDRNPKKDKVLQKHEFAGNLPLLTNRNITSPEPGPSAASRKESSQRGRGGDARGRGGGVGRGGDNDTARGRAWKDKNKARSANHNRKRGHDKKVTRGGGPAS